MVESGMFNGRSCVPKKCHGLDRTQWLSLLCNSVKCKLGATRQNRDAERPVLPIDNASGLRELGLHGFTDGRPFDGSK